jgi:hypothetical protein
MSQSIPKRLMPLLLAMSPGLAAQTWQEVTLPGPLEHSTSRAVASDGIHLYVLGGAGGYGVHRTSDGSSWQTLNSVKGTSAYDLSLTALDFISVADGRIWVGNDPGSLTLNYGYHPLHRLEPGETQWTPSADTGFPGSAMASAANGVAHDPASGNYFAASILGGVYTSTDRTNWQRRTDGLGTGLVYGYSVHVKNGVAFLNQTNGATHRSTDGGATWAAATGMTSTSEFIDTGSRLVVAGSGSIHGTSDLGLTWENLGSLTPNAPIDLTSDGTTIFATQGHNYITGSAMMNYSSTGGLTWGTLPATGFPPGFAPKRLIRHGAYLYALGAVSSGPGQLYRAEIALLDLSPVLGVAVQPKPLVTLQGRAVNLRVVAGGKEPLTYQWRLGGTDINGETSATLSIPSALVSQSGSYSVRVTDAGGNSVTSNAAAVTIMPSGDGRYDPLMTRTGMSASNDHGKLHALPDGSVLGIQAGRHLFKIGPDGANIAQRSLPAGAGGNIQFIDSQGRLVIASDSGGAVAMRRILLNQPGFPDDPGFPTNLTPDSTVRGITEIPGTGYIVAGAFTKIGTTNVDKVALVSYSGTASPFLTETPPGQLHDVHYTPADGGALWLSGTFAYPVNYWPGTLSSQVVKLDLTGNVASGFKDYPYSSESVFILAMQPDGKPILKSAQRIIRLNKDGTRDTGFNAANQTFAPSSAPFDHVALQPDGKLIVAGNFTSFGSNTGLARYCRLNADGTFDTTFYSATGYSSSVPITGLAHDRRGYAYMTAATAATGATFQGVAGIGRSVVRVFASSQTPSSGGYDDWAAALAPDKRPWHVDGDDDGFANVFDFLFGGSPTAADSLGPFIKPAEAILTAAQITAADPLVQLEAGKTYQTVTFRIPKTLHGFTAAPQAAGPQLDFTDGSAEIHRYGPAVDDGDYELRTYYLLPAKDDTPAMFWRLMIRQS